MPNVLGIYPHSDTATGDHSVDSRSAKLDYLVVYDSELLTPVPAETAAFPAGSTPPAGSARRIPIVYVDTHPDDSRRRAEKVSAQFNGPDRTQVLVSVDFSEPKNDAQKNKDPDNPLNDAIIREWSFELADTDWFMDAAATPKPAANTAGEPFDSVPARQVGSITVKITRNIADSDFNLARLQRAYSYTSDPATAVNSDSVTIEGITFSARQLRFAGYKISPKQMRNNIAYRTEEITLAIRKDWRLSIDSRGYNEKSSTAGKLQEISKGTPPVKPDKPWPLDSAGKATANATDTPAKVTLQPYPEMAFAPWGLS